jgi:hypothetical protein
MLDKLIQIILKLWKKPLFRIGLGLAVVLILGEGG